MSTKSRTLVVVLLLTAVAIAAAPPAQLEPKAKDFVSALAAGQYDRAAKSLGAPLAASMNQQQLEKDWQGVVAKNGSFRQIAGVRHVNDQIAGKAVPVVTVLCNFEKGTVRVRLSFDPSGKIVSLWYNAPNEKL